MEVVTRKLVAETLKASQEYVDKLEKLKEEIHEAEKQVSQSAQTTQEQIQLVINNLQNTFNILLEGRKEELLMEVSLIQQTGLTPLKESEVIINGKLEEVKEFINDINEIIKKGGVTSDKQATEFFEKCSRLGSLPAVPDLETVPEITFTDTDSHVEHLKKYISKIGKVTKMGPIQISRFVEKPGGLLVQWEEADHEFQIDTQYFRLQMAYGDIRGKPEMFETNFHDVYAGPELEFLVRNLLCNKPYTFRVSCQIGDHEFSAWSLLKIANTSIQPYTWEMNPSYSITNDSKMASKVKPDSCVLYSDGPQLQSGYSIEFNILECVEGLSDEGILLTARRMTDTNTLQAGVMFLSSQGKIYIDGSLKLTILPVFKKGSVIMISCEHKTDSVMRVHLEHEGKAVTYDWKVTSDKLYFALIFSQPGFKVLVS